MDSFFIPYISGFEIVRCLRNAPRKIGKLDAGTYKLIVFLKEAVPNVDSTIFIRGKEKSKPDFLVTYVSKLMDNENYEVIEFTLESKKDVWMETHGNRYNTILFKKKETQTVQFHVTQDGNPVRGVVRIGKTRKIDHNGNVFWSNLAVGEAYVGSVYWGGEHSEDHKRTESYKFLFINERSKDGNVPIHNIEVNDTANNSAKSLARAYNLVSSVGNILMSESDDQIAFLIHESPTALTAQLSIANKGSLTNRLLIGESVDDVFATKIVTIS